MSVRRVPSGKNAKMGLPSPVMILNCVMKGKSMTALMDTGDLFVLPPMGIAGSVVPPSTVDNCT
eukprot:2800183-Rhodomonas_salina.1